MQGGRLAGQPCTVHEWRPRPRGAAEVGALKKLVIFGGMTVGGWIGWALTQRLGLMTAFLVSSLGSLVGVIVAWRMVRDWLA